MPLKLVRRPKSPNYIIRGTIRGCRVEESSGTSDRRVAEEIRAKREAELLKQSIYGRRAVATFAEAALSYLEHGGERRFLEPVIRHFGTLPLAQVDQDAIDAAARKLFPNVTGATRNRQVYTPVSAVLHHAAKRGWCARPIIDRPDAPPDRIRWLTIEDADRLIDAASEHLRPLLIFLFYTGARAGEALWLDWNNVNLARGHVTFPETKNGEARGVPLHPRVIAALANCTARARFFGDLTAKLIRGRRPPTTRPPAPGSRPRSTPPAAAQTSMTSTRMIAGTPGQPGTTRPTATFVRCSGSVAGSRSAWSCATRTPTWTSSATRLAAFLGENLGTLESEGPETHELQQFPRFSLPPW